MLAFLLSPFGRLLAVAAIALVIGGVGGWRTQKKFADAAMLKAVTAAYQQKVATLQDRVKQVNAAAASDQQRAAAAEARRKQAEDQVNELQQHVSSDQCFSAADTDELRKLWSGPAARAPGRPAAGSR